MKRVRVEHGADVVDGTLDGDEIALIDGTRIAAADAAWLAPVVPRKIVATHLSYRSRCDEYKMAAPPADPSYFLKPLNSLSDITGPTSPARAAAGSSTTRARSRSSSASGPSGVSRADALDHVAGYTVANDFGVHDFRHIDRGSMLRVKGQDGFCPLGPLMVDAADVDPQTSPCAPSSTASRSRRATAAPTCCSPSPTRWPTSRG